MESFSFWLKSSQKRPRQINRKPAKPRQRKHITPGGMIVGGDFPQSAKDVIASSRKRKYGIRNLMRGLQEG